MSAHVSAWCSRHGQSPCSISQASCFAEALQLASLASCVCCWETWLGWKYLGFWRLLQLLCQQQVQVLQCHSLHSTA